MKQLDLFKEKEISLFYASLQQYIVVYGVTLVIWCAVIYWSAIYFYNLLPIGLSMLTLLEKVSNLAIIYKGLFIGLIFLTPLIQTFLTIKTLRSFEND
ncbi:hypothetical protein [Salinicola sp. MIT1003]|jgi:hypothetical protein|uniref:hypothetical protein n=1 Tax=Salinicola sp. MIT1003 TaxID=1882734 RepID=UPI0008DC8D7F|nr:hypothetical protein [Salinicola sp. MIT1003]OHZ03005.1 hypothetical protein BC443_15050 [Salinicola sp. MIT1003]